SWVLKRELMWVPVFGWALATMSPIAIDRKTGRHAVQQIAEQGTRHLHAGRHVMIFPEGTRVAPGQRGRYRLGGGVLAQEAGFPVIPVAHNAGVFWKRRALYKHPGTIDVVIGPPIETRGRDATEIMADVENWIEGQMERLPASPDSAASEPAT
ncbi:MAG: lysophospholipid acyltransferase family protein, partial [Pseudomonadota bacterium]